MSLKNIEIVNNLIYLIITIIILILFLNCLLKFNKKEKFINTYPFNEHNLFHGHKPCKKCKRPGNSCSQTRH